MIFWSFFKQNLKKNTFLLFCGLLFNLFAASSEGISFAFLLTSIAALTHEPIPAFWSKLFPSISMHAFYIFLGGAIALQITRSLAAYLGQLMTTLLTVNIQLATQKRIFHWIFKMEFPEISQHKKGDLIQLATSPPSFIPMLFDEYNRLIISCMMIAACLSVMAKISFPLTGIILAFFALAACIQKLLLAKITQISHTHTDHLTELSKHTSQSLDGIKTIHIFHKQKHILSSLEDILHQLAKATKRLKKWSALIPSLNECLGVFLVGLSLIVGSFLLKQTGNFYTSYLFTYLTLTYRLGTRLQHFMSAKAMIAYYAGPLQRLHMAQISTQTMQSNARPPPFEQGLSFETVSFSYPHKKTSALKQLTLTIPKNKVVALVGMSGAGKTSFIDLLLRLYTPTQGTISLDGQPAHTIPIENWRTLFGVVPQDSFLFNASIEENIRFGKLEATSEEILHAAALAGADTFIQQLPEGYKTIIGERGYRLSGGEKQRICLAQALLKNPPILVLDEATSHLDSQSEQFVQQALKQLRTEKTLLIVAHRLSTIQMADLIFVLENGRIIEHGTHHDLVRLGGRYHNLWQLQTIQS